jgi:glycosyltransferase involved in cell wall biosynthesis
MSSVVMLKGSEPRGRPPLVSVIIPTYNHAQFLSEAIESVLDQTCSDYEIIVVDDGSMDSPEEVVKRYEGVSFIRQSNRGLAGARNRGLQESRGQFIVFLDADDHLLPHHFQKSLDAFHARPEAGLVCGNFRMLGTDPTWRHVHRCEPLPDYFGTLLRINFIGAIHTVMFRREILREVAGFDERLKACEDHDLFLRLARRTVLYCHHQLIAEYRRTGQQLSRRWDVMLKCAMRVLWSQRSHLQNHPEYESAYREGIARCRARYGELALWEMVAVMRAGEWMRALRILRILVTYYPQGLVSLVRCKLARMRPAIGK